MFDPTLTARIEHGMDLLVFGDWKNLLIGLMVQTEFQSMVHTIFSVLNNGYVSVFLGFAMGLFCRVDLVTANLTKA